MAERQVKRWVTVNGHHVPIYEDSDDWMSSDMKARYSMFIDKPELYSRLDSDEKTWVEALRAERQEKEHIQKELQIKANAEEAKRLNERDKEQRIKPWSKAEEKRTKEASDMVMHYLYAGDDKEFMEFYDTDGEEVYSKTLGKEYGTRDNVKAEITKEHFIYAKNYDENDIRVKKGKKVPGSTYYTVSIDEETLDENVAGYKTQKDAQHALEIELDWRRRRELKKRKLNHGK